VDDVQADEMLEAVDAVDVVVVGAGPTGLALAGELRLAGVGCRVLERRAEEPNLTRAFAVHARTLELLDARGLAQDVLRRGIPVQSVAPTPGASVDLSRIPSRFPMVLMVPQSGTETVLERRARDLGADVVRGTEVVGLTQDASGVRLDVLGPQGPATVRARYVVGTDGAHSAVRRLVGVDFAGTQYATHIVLADVRLARPPGDILFGASTSDGLVLVVPFGDGWFRAIVWDRSREDVPLTEPVTLAELQRAFRQIAGDDFGMGEPRWRTRFLSERRQARSYRVGRVLLAGDAAHVHSPIGGQGMNTGIGDALNLGWKLAATLQGWGPPDLLDTYQQERHPVGELVLRMTDGAYRLVMSRTRLGAAWRRLAVRSLLRVPPARRRLLGLMTGIGLSYDRPRGAHPWTGHRMPDVTGTDGRRVYEALRSGGFVLVDSTGWAATGEHAQRVTIVPVPHRRRAPAAVLVRPDGYVAWATDAPDLGAVTAAVRRWCPPAVLPRPSGVPAR
jgi:2-polyprenyl-6-methoxyphenol hydroxylase-like FAD-dependent oxidoreductase